MIDYMKYQGGDEKENKHIQELINLDIKFIYSNAIWFKGQGIGNLDYPSCYIDDSWIEDCPEYDRYDMYKKISYKVIIHPHFFPFLFTTLLEYFDGYSEVTIEHDQYYRCVLHRNILKAKRIEDRMRFGDGYSPSVEFMQSQFDKYKQKTRFTETLRKFHAFLLSKSFIIFILSFILAGCIFECGKDWAFVFGIAAFIIVAVQESFNKIKAETEYAAVLIHREYILRLFNYLSIILLISQIIILIITICTHACA